MGFSVVFFSVLLLAVGLLPGAQPQRQIDPATQQIINNYIKNVFLPSSNITTLGLTIVQNDGQVLYTTGYGLADIERGIEAGNDTQFGVASLTKSFTAVATVELLSQKFPELGEAVLDTPIRTLIPEANFTLIDRFRSEHATFRDLLAHKLCISTDDVFITAEVFNSTSEIIYRQRYAEEICGMRAGITYNNNIYMVAGELLALLAGRPYVELANDLLQRIVMTNSAFASETDDYSQMPYRAPPYYNIEGVSYPMNTDLVKRIVYSLPAGGLFTTPNDMATYMQFHLGQGMVNGNQVVPKEVMAWLLKPSQIIPIAEYKNSEEDKVLSRFAGGLGLMIGSYDGWELLQHSGHFVSYATLLSMFPGKKLGIFTTTNQGPVLGDETELKLHMFIFDVMRGAQNKVDASKLVAKMRLATEEKKLKKNKEVERFLASYKVKGQTKAEIVGMYGSGNQGEIEIFEKFNEETNAMGIYMSYGKWLQGWIENVGGDLYEVAWDTDILHDLYAGGNLRGTNYALIENEILNILEPYGDEFLSYGKYYLGLSLDLLPPIPWAPDSC